MRGKVWIAVWYEASFLRAQEIVMKITIRVVESAIFSDSDSGQTTDCDRFLFWFRFNILDHNSSTSTWKGFLTFHFYNRPTGRWNDYFSEIGKVHLFRSRITCWPERANRSRVDKISEDEKGTTVIQWRNIIFSCAWMEKFTFPIYWSRRKSVNFPFMHNFSVHGEISICIAVWVNFSIHLHKNSLLAEISMATDWNSNGKWLMTVEADLINRYA